MARATVWQAGDQAHFTEGGCDVQITIERITYEFVPQKHHRMEVCGSNPAHRTFGKRWWVMDIEIHAVH